MVSVQNSLFVDVQVWSCYLSEITALLRNVKPKVRLPPEMAHNVYLLFKSESTTSADKLQVNFA